MSAGILDMRVPGRALCVALLLDTYPQPPCRDENTRGAILAAVKKGVEASGDIDHAPRYRRRVAGLVSEGTVAVRVIFRLKPHSRQETRVGRDGHPDHVAHLRFKAANEHALPVD